MTGPAGDSEPAQVHNEAYASGHSRQFIANRDQTINIAVTPMPTVAMRTLPRDVVSFIGRAGELKRLLTSADQQSTAVHIVDGMPGVGKTALVIHAAHRMAGQYPDGQLFVSLHGHTPGRSPADPNAVLTELLRCAGVPSADIPEKLEDRAGKWRSTLAGKRVLLVLDDAISQAQIEPLLPGSAGCLVLVTSRHRLIALSGAELLSLEILPAAHAVRLFTRLAGRSSTEAEAQAVEELIEMCGRLPLAITVLAGRLAHHPAWPIMNFAAQFVAAADRLAQLAAGDRPGDVAVAVAFDMSYRGLSPTRQRLYRFLALHPGSIIDAYAAAALADIPLIQASRDLEALYIDHLVEEPSAGRYEIHDLLRSYLRTLAEREDPVEDRDAAFSRLRDYYLITGLVAGYRLGKPGYSLPTQTPSVAFPDLPDRASARAWLRAEVDNLLAFAAFACDCGHVEIAKLLCGPLSEHQLLVSTPEGSITKVIPFGDDYYDLFTEPPDEE